MTEINSLYLQELLQENDVKLNEINYMINIINKDLINYINYNMMNEEFKDFLMIDKELKRQAKKIGILKNEHTKKAYVIGSLKSIIAVTETYEKQSKNDNLIEYESIINQDPVLCDILRILCKENSINHGELAQLLGMSKSSLTNKMKRIANYKLFDIENHGKYKFYYATHVTRNVFSLHLKNKTSKYNVLDLQNVLIILLSNLSDEIKNRPRLSLDSLLHKMPTIGEEFKTVLAKFVKELNYKIESSKFDKTIYPFTIGHILNNEEDREEEKNPSAYYLDEVRER